MPLAAEASANPVAFIVSGCGPTVSAEEEKFYSNLTELGLPVHEVNRSLDEEFADFEEKYTRGYDPRELLRGIDVATLWILGTADKSVPTMACVRFLRELWRAGRNNHEYHLIAGADHNFYASGSQSGELLDLLIGVTSVGWVFVCRQDLPQAEASPMRDRAMEGTCFAELVNLAMPICQRGEPQCPKTGPGRNLDFANWQIAVLI